MRLTFFNAVALALLANLIPQVGRSAMKWPEAGQKLPETAPGAKPGDEPPVPQHGHADCGTDGI